MSRGRVQSRALLLAACVMVLVGAWTFAGPVSRAKAQITEDYCTNFDAAPFGRQGDRCASMHYVPLYGSLGYGREHSVCVDALDGSGNLVTNWQCAGPGVWYFMGFDTSRWLMAIVRNNTTGDRNHISGKQSWLQ